MKIKRWIKILSASVAVILVLFLLLLSPVAKWYIEKNSEEWTGRKIVMEKLGLNLFNGSVSIEQLRVFERDKTEVFFSMQDFYLNLELWKAINKQYEISEVTMRGPAVSVIQEGDSFNFDDLIAHFTKGDTVSTSAESEPVKYWVKNITINSGAIRYANKGLDNEVTVRELNAACPLISSNNPHLHATLDFRIDKGGDIKSVADMNIETGEYTLSYDMNDLNLDLLFPYLKDYINVGEMKGTIQTQLLLGGNLNEPDAIAANGTLALEDLSITDPNNEPLIGIGSFTIALDTLNTKSDLYNFGSISLVEPFLKFERFDNETNFSRLVNYVSSDSTVVQDSVDVQVDSGNIFELIASYIQDISENYSISNYKADSLILREGTLIFNDYTLHSKFNYQLEHLLAKAERINSDNQNITFLVAAILNTSGKMNGKILVNPDGFRDITIDYSVADLKISDFNPYSHYYVAHPFLDGICYYSTKSSIVNRMLKSQNKFEVRKIIVGKKEPSSTAADLPIRFAVALLRDVNGDIAIDIPIEGNLDDPRYRLGPVIWQIFKNLIVKAVAAPGKLLAKKSGVDEKYLEGFDWQSLQTELDEDQKKALDAAAAALALAPEMNLEFIKAYNVPKELDQLALQESKKRFLFINRRISSEEEVSEEEEKLVESIQARDSVFNAYIDRELQIQNPLLSIFDKSKRLVGTEKLQNKLFRLYEKRTEAIQKYLTETKGVTVNRFRIVNPNEPEELPYESVSRMIMNFYLADEDETAGN
jgi:Domain of Unknown Function (DUF748)